MKQLNIPGVKDLILGRDGDFMIDKTYVKFWPAEYHSQSAIDACLQLRPKVLGKKITEIYVKSFEAAVSIIGSEPEKLRPTSRETADHSMFYCCAAALVDGDVTLATFNDHRLTDPNLLDLIDKTKIVQDAELDKGYPKGIPNDITITCADGTKVSKRVDFPPRPRRKPHDRRRGRRQVQRMAAGVVSEKPPPKSSTGLGTWILPMTLRRCFPFLVPYRDREGAARRIGARCPPARCPPPAIADEL